MERVFDFLSRYDIVSSMIPGMVFCQMLDWIYGMNLMEQRPAAVVVTVYLSGLALGRVGSLVVEPICRKCLIIRPISHEEWHSAVNIDNRISDITVKSTVFRSYCAVAFVHLIIRLVYDWYRSDIDVMVFLPEFGLTVAILGLLLAYRKQVDYVRCNVEEINATIERRGKHGV